MKSCEGSNALETGSLGLALLISPRPLKSPSSGKDGGIWLISDAGRSYDAYPHGL